MSEPKRSTNFSTTEIGFLLQLVEKNKNTIECKKTDRTSSEEKIKAWMEIEAEFNSNFDSYRSFKTLKTKYENLKKNVKQNYAKDKGDLYKTGGGPKAPSNVSAVDEEILKPVQDEQITGHESIYDDDFLSPHKFEASQTNVEKEEVECILIEEPQETPKWDKYSPKLLKMQKHHALNTGRKRKTTDVWAEVGEMKLKKLKLEMKVIEEQLKLQKIKLELEINQLKQNEQNKRDE